MKLGNLGTMGLIDYVVGHRPGRPFALAMGRALKVLKDRGYPKDARNRFKRACNRAQR